MLHIFFGIIKDCSKKKKKKKKKEENTTYGITRGHSEKKENTGLVRTCKQLHISVVRK